MSRIESEHLIIEVREVPHRVADQELRNLLMRLQYSDMGVRYERIIPKTKDTLCSITIRIEGYKAFKAELPAGLIGGDIEVQFECLENQVYHMIMDSFIRLIKKCNEVDSAKHFLNLP